MNWTGLAALVWDPSGGDSEQPDQEFIRRVIAADGEPALDVGCGTGRLLLRYLAQGLDVDGMDTSADMLEILREKAAERGLRQPDVWQQGMQELDAPRLYRTIYVPCGTFVLLTDREEAWEALRRFYAHLEPGGKLLMNVFWPVNQEGFIQPANSPMVGEWYKLFDHQLPDGRIMKQTMKNLEIDLVEQLLIAHRRYQLYEGDDLVAEEIFDANERWYYKHELVLMLERVGFAQVEVNGNWSEEPFRQGEHYSMVFVAQKPHKKGR